MTPRRIGSFLSLQDVLITTTTHNRLKKYSVPDIPVYLLHQIGRRPILWTNPAYTGTCILIRVSTTVSYSTSGGEWFCTSLNPVSSNKVCGNWFVCDLQICCHFTTQNSGTTLKTNDPTNKFLICKIVLSEQLVLSLITVFFEFLSCILKRFKPKKLVVRLYQFPFWCPSLICFYW